MLLKTLRCGRGEVSRRWPRGCAMSHSARRGGGNGKEATGGGDVPSRPGERPRLATDRDRRQTAGGRAWRAHCVLSRPLLQPRRHSLPPHPSCRCPSPRLLPVGTFAVLWSTGCPPRSFLSTFGFFCLVTPRVDVSSSDAKKHKLWDKRPVPEFPGTTNTTMTRSSSKTEAKASAEPVPSTQAEPVAEEPAAVAVEATPAPKEVNAEPKAAGDEEKKGEEAKDTDAPKDAGAPKEADAPKDAVAGEASPAAGAPSEDAPADDGKSATTTPNKADPQAGDDSVKRKLDVEEAKENAPAEKVAKTSEVAAA
mmetsp:Transcript_37104/g.86964  ORF Transcript_37104/g.86964 Transcript_37104/m.86964 type:complete len:309 (-) Transcript_37104:179-1105(-)